MIEIMGIKKGLNDTNMFSLSDDPLRIHDDSLSTSALILVFNIRDAYELIPTPIITYPIPPSKRDPAGSGLIAQILIHVK